MDIPPNDTQSEKCALGAGATTPEALATLLEMTSREDFYFDVHRIIYDAFVAMHAAGTPVDALTLSEELNRQGTFDDVGGVPYITSILDAVPHAAHIKHYCRTVVDRSKRRKTIRKLEQGLRQAFDLSVDIEHAIAAVDLSELNSDASDDVAISSAELDMADYEIEYFIPGILAKRNFCLVAGPSKGCKTTVLVELALSLSSGAKFLNEFCIPALVRVGIISAESGPGVLQETARRIAKSKPWRNLADYENLIWKFNVPKLSEPGAVRKLIRFVKEYGLDVLILDPFYLMAGLSEDAGNMFVVGRLLAELQIVGNETGVTLVVAHHFKKLGFADQYSTPELGMVAWSGFEQYARQWLLLNRREAYDAEVGLHKLWLAAGGSAGHGGLFAVDAHEGRQSNPGGRCWEVSVTKASEARQQAKRERDEQKEADLTGKLERDIEAVLEALGKHPDGISKSLLRDLTGVGARIGKILPVILADGRAVPCRFKATNGQEYQGFKLGTRTLGQTQLSDCPSDCPTDTAHTLGQRSLLRERVRPSGVCGGVGHTEPGGDHSEILSECPGTDEVDRLFGGRPA